MGLVQFQIAPHSSLHFSIFIGPFRCSQCYLQDFNLLHWSLLKQCLQCLISTLTQAGGGGLLFRFASSVLLQGGRGTVGRHCCVWGALTVFWPHWVCPRPGLCVFRLPVALYGAGPVLRVVPVFGYSTKAQTRLGLSFVPSPARAVQAARSLMGALSLGAVHLLPSTARASWVCATCV